MDDPSHRLKLARQSAGYPSAAAAARAFGWSIPGYSHHENGTRQIRADVAARYARAFRTTKTWLLFGEGDAPPEQPSRRLSEEDMGDHLSGKALRTLHFLKGYLNEGLIGVLESSRNYSAADHVSREMGWGSIPDLDLVEAALLCLSVQAINLPQSKDIIQFNSIVVASSSMELDDPRMRHLVASVLQEPVENLTDAPGISAALMQFASNLGLALGTSRTDRSETADWKKPPVKSEKD